jgi:hypothetical protein
MVEDHNYRKHPPFIGDTRTVNGRLEVYEFDGWMDYEQARKREYIVGPVEGSGRFIIRLGDK